MQAHLVSLSQSPMVSSLSAPVPCNRGGSQESPPLGPSFGTDPTKESLGSGYLGPFGAGIKWRAGLGPRLKMISAFRHRQGYKQTSGSVSPTEPGATEGQAGEGRARGWAASGRSGLRTNPAIVWPKCPLLGFWVAADRQKALQMDAPGR